jgi:hypothetical protein
MAFNIKDLTGKALISFSLTSVISPCLLADEKTSLSVTSSQTFDQKKAAWSQLNHYSPTEGFYSKGSYGLHVGIGALAPMPQEHTETFTKSEQDELKEARPRLFLSKGTAWPIDFGGSLSLLQGSSKAMQGGIHTQWTLFEGFQLPSIAVRASRSILTHYSEVKSLTTDAIELGVSYGIIRYVIISTSIKQRWEKGKTQSSGYFLGLTSSELPSWTDSSIVFSWGINISPFTPYVQIGVEQSQWDGRTQVSLAKLSFLL